ncbi:MAG: ABC transporter ATP-binding protein, partial [Spirochaetales bacterium]
MAYIAISWTPNSAMVANVNTASDEPTRTRGDIRDTNSNRVPGIGIGRGGGAARFRGEIQKPTDALKTFSRIMGRFGAERRSIVTVFILAAFETIGALSAPRLIGAAVDAMGRGGRGIDGVGGPLVVLQAARLAPFATAVSALALAYIAVGILSFAQAWIIAKVSQRMASDLRTSLFNKLGTLPLTYLDSRPRGDIMSRIANDCDAVGTAISQSAIQLAAGTASVVGALVMMLLLSRQLALVTLASVPLVLMLSRIIAGKTRPYFKRHREALGALNGIIEESASGLDTIRAFGMEDRMEAEFATENSRLREAGARAQIWTGFLMPMLNVINNASFAGIALVGGYLAAKGGLSVGVIASFIAYSRL